MDRSAGCFIYLSPCTLPSLLNNAYNIVESKVLNVPYWSEEVLSEAEEKQAQVIFNLLKEATSQTVVREFLREKDIAITAPNWDELYSNRILPALQSKKLSLVDLATLLQDVEEHGRQHIFLYKCSPADARAILNKTRIHSIAKDLGVAELLSHPLHIEMPEEAKIVDIRLPEAPNGTGPVSLTVKISECRETSKLVNDDYDPVTSSRTKTYKVTKKRAVNIATLTLDGLLEIRIASRDNSTKYHEQVSDVIRMASKFFPMDSFEILSLSKAKDTLFLKKEEFEGIIRYSSTTARNDYGIAMNLAASNLSQNLSEDDGSSAAMKEFLAQKGFVTGSNIWFIINGEEERQIHVLLNGEINEFAVTAACTPGEYSYVCGQILSLN